MAYTIAFFGTKPYDESSFNKKNKEFGFEIRYYKGNLQKNNAWVRQTIVGSWEKDLHWILEELTEYNDGGTNLPNVYLVLGKRIIDLSGMQKGEQIASLGNVELAGFAQTEPLILAATKRVDA